MEKIFGTDGVRGVVGEKITKEFVYDLAKSVGIFLNKEKGKKVLIAHDTRVSANMIEKEASKALNQCGIDVVLGGIMPTPAVHYLAKKHNFDLAIMITASHNPAEYNGLKLITKDGLKFSTKQEDEITEIYHNISKYSLKEKLGQTKSDESLKDDWAKSLIGIIDDDFSGLKIALDCANGASFELAEKIFKKLGAEVVVICNQNDGNLINKDCGSTHLEKISKTTKQEKCDLGFAFDGDADRVNAVFGNGEIISGEELLFLSCMALYEQKQLKNNKIITPYVTNCGVDKSLEKYSVSVVRCDVGGKNIQEKILEQNISFGAEDNGHIVWGDYNKCSDGILTALFLTKLYKHKDFKEICKNLKLFEQVKLNVNVSEKQKEKFLNGALNKDLEELNKQLNKDERIIVRASGTEPLFRVVVEGTDLKTLKDISKKVEALIKNL